MSRNSQVLWRDTATADFHRLLLLLLSRYLLMGRRGNVETAASDAMLSIFFLELE